MYLNPEYRMMRKGAGELYNRHIYRSQQFSGIIVGCCSLLAMGLILFLVVTQ